ncbi:hypothetical protein NHX12_031361, partial [Muraenolepis orangiensis]
FPIRGSASATAPCPGSSARCSAFRLDESRVLGAPSSDPVSRLSGINTPLNGPLIGRCAEPIVVTTEAAPPDLKTE